jgi:hypothetical protein
MTAPHLRLAHDPESASLIRASVRVRTAAAALDMDESQVRRLLEAGDLEGHGHGIRGVRIFVDSIRAYQEGRPLGGVIHKSPTGNKPAKSAAHGEAVAFLASMKLV